MKQNKDEKLALKVSVAINQKYIRALTRLLNDITKALRNYAVTLKKIGKEE